MLAQLFTKGYFVTKVDASIADRVKASLDTQEFSYVFGDSVYLETPTFQDKALQFPEVWSFDGKATQSFDIQVYPEALTKAWTELRKVISSFETIMGAFDYSCMLAHRFSVGSQIGFHSDTIEASFFGCILYLGDSDFSYSDGGYLRLGRARLDSKGVVQDVSEYERVLPNHGTLVLVNNVDPTFVHAVEPLKTQKNRMTQACRFGYAANRFAQKQMGRGGYA